jgi:hypothetical protein
MFKGLGRLLGFKIVAFLEEVQTEREKRYRSKCLEVALLRDALTKADARIAQLEAARLWGFHPIP